MTHGKRAELQALQTILQGMADDDPGNISFGAATHLAGAAADIGKALEHAVSKAELDEQRAHR